MNTDKELLKVLEIALGKKLEKRATFFEQDKEKPAYRRKSIFGTQKPVLTALDLSDFELKEIHPLVFSFKHLETLNLDRNKLTHIPDKIRSVKRLKRITLSNNEFTELPKALFYIESLKEIAVEDNPLNAPPVEIIARGRDAVIAYFDSLELGHEPITINECKLIFLGEGAAGKTSLSKKLRGIDYDPQETTTHGINIEDYIIKLDGKDVKLNYWDFGGQEIMHATHQFFFTKRSLYLLVIDSRKEDKTEYWLKLIRTLARNSPVLIVMNKMDQHPNFEVNRKFLREKYPNIIGFYPVSCLEETGLEELRQGISDALKKVELLNTKWPANWHALKLELESIQDDFISYKEFRDMANAYNIQVEESQNVLVDYLHDLGIVIHFKDLELMDTHVLDPHWITTAVYKLINADITRRQEGILSMDDVGFLLSPDEPEEEQFIEAESPDSIIAFEYKNPQTTGIRHQAREKILYHLDLILSLIKSHSGYQDILLERLADFMKDEFPKS